MAERRKQATTQAVARWDDQLAQYASEASDMESSTVSSQFISTRGGVLTFNDAQMPNNEVVVIILDYILENVWYPGPYDPDSPQSPMCFAFGKDEKLLAPHAEAADPQNDVCAGCVQNAWGTADRGRGKACRNTRRLAMIGIGSYNQQGQLETLYDESNVNAMTDHVAKTQIALLKLPVTSVKGYSAYVKLLSGGMRRPPFAVITRLWLEPHPKDQFHVLFEPIETVPDVLIQTILARRTESEMLLFQPYVPMEAEPVAPAARGGRRAAPAAARTAPAARRSAATSGRKY